MNDRVYSKLDGLFITFDPLDGMNELLEDISELLKWKKMLFRMHFLVIYDIQHIHSTGFYYAVICAIYLFSKYNDSSPVQDK